MQPVSEIAEELNRAVMLTTENQTSAEEIHARSMEIARDFGLVRVYPEYLAKGEAEPDCWIFRLPDGRYINYWRIASEPDWTGFDDQTGWYLEDNA